MRRPVGPALTQSNITSGPKRVSTPFAAIARCHWQTNNFTRFIFHINDFSAVYCLLSVSLFSLSFSHTLTLCLSSSSTLAIHCFTNCPLTCNYASLTQRLMGAESRLFALCRNFWKIPKWKSEKCIFPESIDISLCPTHTELQLSEPQDQAYKPCHGITHKNLTWEFEWENATSIYDIMLK